MDEATRKIERTVAASGDRIERARLAHQKLRSGDPTGALAVLDGTDGAASGLEVATRALALQRLGRAAEALATVEKALDGGVPDLEPAAVLEALGPALEGRVPLGRARAARVLVRASGSVLAAIQGELRQDKDCLVRLAASDRVREPFRFEDRGHRVYGSHGADYETGHFVAFEAPLALRLETFEAGLFEAVEAAIAALSDDENLIHGFRLRVAFSGTTAVAGYGLGGSADAGSNLLEAAVVKLDGLGLLPWKVRYAGIVPYDLMEDPARLARRLGRDLAGHPARQLPAPPEASFFQRLVASHPARGPAPRRAAVAPLLEEAIDRLTPTGVAACEAYFKFIRGELKL